MFKLFVVISTLCALATARPGYLNAPLHAPLLSYAHAPVLHPAPIIKVLPPAISHQSSTIVHSAPIVAPILAPAVKTVIAPAYHPAPLLSAYHGHGLPLGPHYH